MERTITLSIEKAREFYLSGNDDLRAIALSAYTEDELVAVGLPSWILTGSSSAWIPDRVKSVPTMFDVEDYVDDIRYRQEELNKN